MRSLFLSLFTTLLMISLASNYAFAQKYHSANDGDVEFSLEEKTQGPKPFYIDKEAIEKARRAQYATEKKEAVWLAKRLSVFLNKIHEQKIAEQNRAAMARTELAQQSMNTLPSDVQRTISAQNEQARAVLARAQAQQQAFDQSIKNTPQGTEMSRTLASLDTPAVHVLKHHPKRSHAKKLWEKMSKMLTHKSQQAAVARRAITKTFVKVAPSILPLGMLSTKAQQASRAPASASAPSTTAPASIWQGVTRKITGAFNKLKSQLFNW